MKKPHYLAGIIFILVGILAAFILKPFLTALILAVILAYIFYPLYTFFLQKTKRKNLSAVIVSIFIVLIITIPFLLMVNTISKEVRTVNIIFKNMISEGKVFDIDCDDDEGFACRANDILKTFSDESSLDYYMVSGLKKLSNTIIIKTTQFISQIPMILLNIFVMLFSVFYLFKDGPDIVEKFKRSIPFKPEHKQFIFKHSKEIVHAVIYGHMITAIIQGAIGGVGLFLFGVNSPITWGIVMALCALIPFLGTAIVWLPAGLFQIINGLSADNSSMVGRGIGLILYGAIIISTIDNIIKPRIIGTRANIHPLIVLLGILGGLTVFGFIGIVLGPLILSLFIVLIDIYQEEKIIR